MTFHTHESLHSLVHIINFMLLKHARASGTEQHFNNKGSVSRMKLFTICTKRPRVLAITLTFVFLLVNKLMFSVLIIIIPAFIELKLLEQVFISFIADNLNILKVVIYEFGCLEVSKQDHF